MIVSYTSRDSRSTLTKSSVNKSWIANSTLSWCSAKVAILRAVTYFLASSIDNLVTSATITAISLSKARDTVLWTIATLTWSLVEISISHTTCTLIGVRHITRFTVRWRSARHADSIGIYKSILACSTVEYIVSMTLFTREWTW